MTLNYKQNKEWLEHFYYEVSMMKLSLYIARKNFSDKIIQNNKMNIVLEIFLLHARNLLEFFYDKNDCKKDIAHVNHFLKSGIKWKKIQTKSNSWYKSLNKKINIYLSHMNYNRKIDIKEKEWNLLELKKDFNNIIKVFLKNIDDKYLTGNIVCLKREFLSNKS